MELVVSPDQRYAVELLADAPPSWPGLKVMCMDPDIHLTTGSTVTLIKDDSATSYTVAQTLGPAAPRGWRFFLLPLAAAPTSGLPVGVATTEGGDNTEKYYTIQVAGLIGNGVRRSTQSFKIPYSSFSAEFQRITKAGGKIVSITPVPRLG